MIAGFAIFALVSLVAVVALGVGLALAGVFTGEDPAAWARTNAVDLTPDTSDVLAAYLRNRRGLRRIGAFAGLILPPAITAGTGIDLQVSGIVWVLLGYLVGLLVAELTFARVASTGPRVASLTTRRLADYLPRPLAVAQIILPVGNAVLAVVAVQMVDDRSDTAAALVTGSTFQDLTAAAIVAGPIAVFLATGALLGERTLVRRPQPMVEPDLVALDDAMRSSSVRTVAATSVAATSFLLASQLGGIGQALGPGSSLQLPIALISGFVLLAAFLAWQWWVNRGWRVRRATGPVLEVQP